MGGVTKPIINMKQQNVGDIVNFFPSKNAEGNPKLPEGEDSVPAEITSTHDKSCDLKITVDGSEPIEFVSIQHKSAANEEAAYWDWPEGTEE